MARRQDDVTTELVRVEVSRHRFVLVAVLAAAALSACAPGGSGAIDETPSLPGAVATATPGADRPGSVPSRPAGEKPDVVAAYPASEALDAALADDRLTREEYEQAFASYQACMDRYGVPLVDVVTSGDSISFASLGGPAEDYCYETHYQAADIFWQTIESPKVDVSVDYLTYVITCYREAGIDPVVTEVPAERRARAVAARALSDQFSVAFEAGLFTYEQAVACSTYDE